MMASGILACMPFWQSWDQVSDCAYRGAGRQELELREEDGCLVYTRLAERK